MRHWQRPEDSVDNEDEADEVKPSWRTERRSMVRHATAYVTMGFRVSKRGRGRNGDFRSLPPHHQHRHHRLVHQVSAIPFSVDSGPVAQRHRVIYGSSFTLRRCAMDGGDAREVGNQQSLPCSFQGAPPLQRPNPVQLSPAPIECLALAGA